MLCENCKKNQATKTYEMVMKGKKVLQYYCLDCYDHLFHVIEERQGDACPFCGTTVQEFQKRNLVGCAKCYSTMQQATLPAVLKMQGSEIHTGKKPIGGSLESVARRCNELKLVVDKLNLEKNFAKAGAYTERLVKLQAGASEEDYVWRKHHPSLKA